MSVILLSAAGMIAAAAVWISPLRPVRAAGRSARPAPAPADDRGITLQTLIITAVVVLLAVAVGVVIIAVTDSSSDDLEETAPEVAGLCNEVEIYDPEVASRNEKGVQIAHTNFARPGMSNRADQTVIELIEFEGSDIGCVPVCVWVEPNFAISGDGADLAGIKNRLLQPGEVVFVRDLSQRPDLKINVGKPVFPATERRFYLLASGYPLEEISYFARENEGNGEFGELVKEPIEDKDFVRTGVTYIGNGSNANVRGGVVRVAVSPDGNDCLTYDEYGNILLFDQQP